MGDDDGLHILSGQVVQDPLSQDQPMLVGHVFAVDLRDLFGFDTQALGGWQALEQVAHRHLTGDVTHRVALLAGPSRNGPTHTQHHGAPRRLPTKGDFFCINHLPNPQNW